MTPPPSDVADVADQQAARGVPWRGWERRWPLVLAVLATAAVALVTGLSPRSPFSQTVGDLGILVGVVSAVVGCLGAARRGGPAARGWYLLATAAAVWTSGHLVWAWYGVTRDHVYPFPSTADFGYITYCIPAVIGLLIFPRSTTRRFSAARALLDACVIAGSLLFISWATVLGDVAALPAGWARTVSLGYPLADVLVASVVLTLGMRVPAAARRPWLLLGSGLLLLTLTDSIYVSVTTAGATGTTGTPMAAAWMAAWLLVAFAGSAPAGHTVTRQRHFTVLQEVLPLVPVVFAIVTAALTPFEQNPVLVATGLAALAALLVQQLVGALDKVRLANGLEAEIEVRTAALLSAEARFGALIGSSDEAILGKTVDGVVTSWNAAAEELYGYAEAEILGRSIELLVPVELRLEEEKLRARAAKGEQVRGHETQRMRKDGSRVPVALTVSPIREDGVVVGISAIGHDITERLQRDAELVEARTRAVAAATVKTDFLATMSHEIRTPMNGVIGLTSLLLDTALDDTQRRYASGVRGAGEALLGIIDDILDFSKLEADKVMLEDIAFDPRALVDEVGVLLAASAADKDIELVVDCSPGIPPALRGDPGRIRQVLINLTANAVKFTPHGEVVLRARQRTLPDGREVVEFSVSDTGIGIDTSDQERLFEPFSQADASTTRRFGGTGLGLAICRRLVVAMEGQLELESALGVGSTFSFTVPLVGATMPVAPTTPDPSLARMRVLVVDDNATNRMVLQDQLRSWNVHVEVASDADAGWDLLRRAAAEGNGFDAALLDMCMPDVDGLELAARAADDPALADVHTVILTSVGHTSTERLAAARVRACMTKPIRSSELYDVLLTVAVTSAHPASGLAPEPGPGRGARTAASLGRVLVVEDNAVNQLVAEGVLRSLGYDVELAENGLVALDALAGQDYAVVLMDCHMPEMDGFEATAELRRREGTARRTPVVAMTAGVLAEDRARCTAAGMDDFVAKPVDVQLLAAVLARWMTTASGAAPSSGVRDGADVVNPDALDVLDTGRLDVLRRLGANDGWGVLPAVAEAFLRTAPGEWDGLRDAGHAGDAAEAQSRLHRMRGAAANLGALQLAATCEALENALRSGAPVDADLLDQVRTDSGRACDALAAVLAGRT